MFDRVAWEEAVYTAAYVTAFIGSAVVTKLVNGVHFLLGPIK